MTKDGWNFNEGGILLTSHLSLRESKTFRLAVGYKVWVAVTVHW